MTKGKSIIIIGSNPMTRLSLIRSIGEVTHCDITVVDMVHEIPKKDIKPVDCYSIYVKRLLRAKKYDADGLCKLLLDQCINNDDKPLILSVDDDSAFLIDSSLDKLREHFHFAHINNKQGEIGRLMNKQVQKQLAVQAGFNVTKSWVVEHRDGHYVLPKGITYPCYLKGLLCYHTMKSNQGRFDSEEDLARALNKLGRSSKHPLMVEEFIETEKDLGIMGFCDGTHCVVPAIVDLLESGRGAHKGVSAFGMVRKEKKGEGLAEKVGNLAKSIGLFGLFNVDLAIAKEKVYFIELNLRYAAYGYAITKAGVNLPSMMVKSVYSDVLEMPVPAIQRECSYINEKVALDDVAFGLRSMKDFRSLQQKADVALMNEPTDNTPYLEITRRFPMDLIKQRIKNILHIK